MTVCEKPLNNFNFIAKTNSAISTLMSTTLGNNQTRRCDQNINSLKHLLFHVNVL